VQRTIDAHGADRGALQRAQQYAPKSIAEGHAEAPLERLSEELAVGAAQGLAVDEQVLGRIKSRQLRCIEHSSQEA